MTFVATDDEVDIRRASMLQLRGGRGPWGQHPKVLAALAREFADAPRDVPVERAAVTDEPALAGARETALQQLRDALGLRRPGTAAIDVPALLQAVEPDTEAAAELRTALARAVAGVLSAVVALADPAVVLVGGPWGQHPKVLAALAREFADAPRDVPVEPAAVTDEPALAGARETALQQLRDSLVAAAGR